MKKSIAFILLTFVCFSSVLQASSTFTDANTALAIQINVGKIYNDAVDSLLSVFDSKESKIQERAKEILKILAEKTQSPEIKDTKPETISTSIKDYQKNGVFIPTGLLQYSLSKDFKSYLSLQAKINIDSLNSALTAMCEADNQPPFFKKENDKIIISKEGYSAEFSSDGVKLGDLKLSNESKSWNSFDKLKDNDNVYAVIEANVKLLQKMSNKKNNIENTANQPMGMGMGMGEAMAMGALESAKDKTKEVDRIRLIIKEKTWSLGLKANDKTVRDEILKGIKESIEDFKKQPMAKDANGNNIELPEIDFMDKASWVGIIVHNKIPDMETGTAMLKFVESYGAFVPFAYGFIKQFDFSNVNKESIASNRSMAKKKSCQSNMRILEGAVEMYNMDNEKSPITELNTEEDFNKLKNGYLGKILTCPETNKNDYSVKVLGDKIEVICKTHGSLGDASMSSSFSSSSFSSSSSSDFSSSFTFGSGSNSDSDSDYTESDYNRGSYSSVNFGSTSMAKYGVGVTGIKPSTWGSGKFEVIFGSNDMDKDLDKKVGSCKSCMTVIRETSKVYSKDKNIDNYEKVTFEDMLKEKYFSAMPTCPARGKYKILPEYDVECSEHGKLSQFK